MAWEWVLLAVLTVAGPLAFRRFIVVRQVVTTRGGAVYAMDYGPAAQWLNTALKFAVFWLVALLLSQRPDRMWLRLWVLALPPLIVCVHLALARRHRVHGLSGGPRT